MRVLVMVRANEDTESGVPPDEKGLAAMGKFNEELVRAGVMLGAEGLHSSSSGARVHFSGKKATAHNGPFETRELIAGFWIWQVKSLDEAIEWIKRSPFESGEVEIREIWEMQDIPAMTPELRKREQDLRARIGAQIH